MQRLVQAAIVLATLVALGPAARAATIVAYPNQVPDEEIPRVAWGDAPAGWGPDSWMGPAIDKSNYHTYLTPSFGHDVLLRDIASISFWTKNDGSIANAGKNWWLSIYTEPTSPTKWYNSRLHAHPDGGYAAGDRVETYGEWNQWATDAENNPLLFYDSTSKGGGTNLFATFDQLTAGTVNWDATKSYDYSGETVLCVTLQTTSNWNGFDGLVDGLTITLTNGETLRVDLAAVPEPSSLALLGLGGVVGLTWLRRRRTAR